MTVCLFTKLLLSICNLGQMHFMGKLRYPFAQEFSQGIRAGRWCIQTICCGYTVLKIDLKSAETESWLKISAFFKQKAIIKQIDFLINYLQSDPIYKLGPNSSSAYHTLLFELSTTSLRQVSRLHERDASSKYLLKRIFFNFDIKLLPGEATNRNKWCTVSFVLTCRTNRGNAFSPIFCNLGIKPWQRQGDTLVLLYKLLQLVLLYHIKSDTWRTDVVDSSNDSLQHADEELGPNLPIGSPLQTNFQ